MYSQLKIVYMPKVVSANFSLNYRGLQTGFKGLRYIQLKTVRGTTDSNYYI